MTAFDKLAELTDEEIITLAEQVQPDIGCSVFHDKNGVLMGVEWSDAGVLEFARKILTLVAAKQR